MSNERIATVTEANATGTTAEIFADIRATMGVALVNLVWRHLATSTAALEWSWVSLKPAYQSGAIPDAAVRLRAGIRAPVLRPIAPSEMSTLQLAQERLTEEGVSEDTLAVVRAVLRTYERGNAQNLVALSALRLRLANPATPDGLPHSGAHLPRGRARVSRGRALEWDDAADRVDQPLPPLPSIDSLPRSVQADVEAMAAAWVPAAQRGMLPSVFRHLAHWPKLLGAFRHRLEHDTDAALINKLARAAIDDANRSAMGLVQELAAAPRLPTQTSRWLSNALDLFIDAMIGRGVVIVPALSAALPAAPPDPSESNTMEGPA